MKKIIHIHIKESRSGHVGMNAVHELWMLIKHRFPHSKYVGDGHELLQLPELMQLETLLILSRLGRLKVEREDVLRENIIRLEIIF